ncbi:MAG: efflux RND transporter periplasmic adaptor subunit [Rhodocyclaceae bacterium]|nr:efflux RND transporter periplasmic adaptor subunit [Rhodocyclaceae bacterium]
MRLSIVMPVLAAAALAACSAPDAPPAQVPAVLVHTVGEVVAPAGRYFTGEIVPRHASALGFRVGGKLLTREADVGAVVKKGDALARLDAADMRLGASAAQAQRAAAQSDLALARAELARVQALRARNFVSDSVVDQQRTAMEAAAARFRQAQAQAALAGNQTDYATLTADADGVITAVAAEPGQVLAAGQPVLTLAHEGEREVRINVPEGVAVAVGDPAQVRLWADRDTIFDAVVREVAPAADAATRTFTVKVTVQGAAQAVPLGATATVALAGGDVHGVLLPLRAVGERDGATVVWRYDPAAGTVSPVAVTVAQFSEAGAQVAEGIDAGAQVVVAGIHLLQPGQAVRAVPASAPVSLDAGR